MFTLVKHPEGWVDKAQNHQHYVMQEFRKVSPTLIKVNREQLNDETLAGVAVVHVVKGSIGVMAAKNRLFAMESGDCWLGYTGDMLKWYQEGALELEIWTWSDIEATNIPTIIHGFNDLMIELMSHNTSVPPDPMPGFDFFQSGDVIIQEGEPADAVYTLIQGKAKVMIEGQQVGEAKENEIIGLQAMLLKSRRTATVVADGPCSAVRVNYDKFRSLIETRPELVISTLETMALQIARANELITKPE